MAIDPYDRYSNEAERANWDIYDDWSLGLYKNIELILQFLVELILFKVGHMLHIYRYGWYLVTDNL